VVVKIITFFLIFMIVLGMFGRLKLPGAKRLATAKCDRCGRYRIGRGPCACKKGNG
jgi:hypothetical protein